MKIFSSQYLSKNIHFYNLRICAPPGQIAQKTMEKQKNNPDPCPLPGLFPDPVHGSEMFVLFLVFSTFMPFHKCPFIIHVYKLFI